MRCCCKNPDAEHVAVASQASANAPKARRMTDRGGGFDDDKAALQKWRDQQHVDTNNTKGGPSNSPVDIDAVSSGSDSSDTYDCGIDETMNPVIVSTRAVHAWQQSPQPPPKKLSPPPQTQKLSPPQTSPRLREDLRSPFEVKTVAPRNQNVFRNSLLDQEEEEEEKVEEAAVVTPDASPANPTSLPEVQAAKPQLLSPVTSLDELDQLMMIGKSSTTLPTANLSPSKISRSTRRSSPRQSPRHHDHEGLRDQLIRDVVLRQQASASSSEDEIDQAKMKGKVFRKRGMPSASSEEEEERMKPIFRPPQRDEDPDTTYEYEESDTGVSDIFSDPALEEVANSMANDSESRERYILACRLLRTRITQRNPPPILSMERDLLLDLQDRFQSSKMGGSAVAYEALSKLLEEEGNDLDMGIAPISHSHSSSSSSREEDNYLGNIREEEHNYLGLTPLTNDRSTSGGTVTSIREEETGFNTVLRGHQYQYHNYHSKHVVSWPVDEKNPKAIPELLEEEEEDEKLPVPTTTTTTSMIRLNGWESESTISMQQYPFHIMGLDEDTPPETLVLTPALMEALRGFFPYSVSEDNFLLKYSLARDGASLRSLLQKVLASQHTIICVETNNGEVFGSFCSTPWRNTGEQQKWFGTGESFLWKLKQSRYVPDNNRNEPINNEMEVYPFTNHDDMVQYCTATTLAVGGGSWNDTVCPYPGEPTGIGLLLDGDLEGGETNSCATFANPRLYGRGTSSNEFTIQNCEVWTLTPMNSITAAEQLERQKYFIREHTESSSLPRPDSSPRRARPPLSASPMR